MLSIRTICSKASTLSRSTCKGKFDVDLSSLSTPEEDTQHSLNSQQSLRNPTAVNTTNPPSRDTNATTASSCCQCSRNMRSPAQVLAGLQLEYENFGLPSELRYEIMRPLLTISQCPDFIPSLDRHQNFYLPILALNHQARYESLDMLFNENLWICLEISHSSELNIFEFFADRLDSQAYLEERAWRGRIKPSLPIEIGIMTRSVTA
jgi:hypothetical protein